MNEPAIDEFLYVARLRGAMPLGDDEELSGEQLKLLLQAYHALSTPSTTMLEEYGWGPDDARIHRLYRRWSAESAASRKAQSDVGKDKSAASRKNDTKRVKGYAPWKPQKKTEVILAQVSEILEEYSRYLPLTGRQIFYRLVGVYNYPKDERHTSA